MRNKWMVWGSLLSVFLLIVALYHLHITNNPVVTIQNKGDIAGKNMTVHLEKGPYWYHEIFYVAKLSPQFAIWFEDLEGNYIGTFYVTGKFYQCTHEATDKAPNRIEALPVWWHKQNKAPLTDTITAATPKQRLYLDNKITDVPSKFIVKMEINNSFDYNAHYTIDGVNGSIIAAIGGQPAIIYSAVVDLNAVQKEYELYISGQSSYDGHNGEISPNIDNLTTAREIVNRIILNIN